jgi:signal transduction histidine kinase
MTRRIWRRLTPFLILASPPALAVQAPSHVTSPRVEALLERAKAPQGEAADRRAGADAERLAEHLAAGGDRFGSATAWRAAGVLAMYSADYPTALRRFDRAIEGCRALGDDECLGKALNNSGIAYKRLGGFLPALQRISQAADAFSRAGKAELAAGARYNVANFQYTLSDYASALATYEAIERDYPHSTTMLGMLVTKAEMLVEMRRPREAKAAARAALARLDAGAEPHGFEADVRLAANGALGGAHAVAGERTAALRLLDEGIRAATASGSENEEFLANWRYLRALVALGSPAQAIPYAERAVALAAVEDDRNRADVLLQAAVSYHAAKRPAEAFRLLKQAFDLVLATQKAEVSAAAGAAVASSGLAERNTLIRRERVEAALARAEQARRAAARETLGVVAIGLTVLLAGAFFFWLRLRQERERHASVLDERTRVARDLHDTLIQGFTGVTLQLQQAARAAPDDARAKALSSAAAASLMEARNAVWQIRSDAIEQGDLRAAITGWLCTVDTDAAKTTSSLDELPPKLPRDITEDLLRFVQEAVTNALRHAEAYEIAVQATRVAPWTFELSVTDNGRGFEPAATDDGRWGLIGMRERVERAGGRFALTSRSGGGTRVVAAIDH